MDEKQKWDRELKKLRGELVPKGCVKRLFEVKNKRKLHEEFMRLLDANFKIRIIDELNANMLNERFCGQDLIRNLKISPGNVYPYLRKLEKIGVIKEVMA